MLRTLPESKVNKQNAIHFRIKITLSLGHSFAKMNKGGGLNKAQGVNRIFEIN